MVQCKILFDELKGEIFIILTQPACMLILYEKPQDVVDFMNSIDSSADIRKVNDFAMDNNLEIEESSFKYGSFNDTLSADYWTLVGQVNAKKVDALYMQLQYQINCNM